MSRQKLLAIGLSQVLWLGLVASSLALGSAPVAAQAANDTADGYVVEQGDRCVAMTEVGDGSQSAEEFYVYNESGRWSSAGTDEYQVTTTSQLFVYRGSEGVSLVFLHDRRADSAGGGGLTMDITGLPADGEWAVRDDFYPNRDDRWSHTETSARVDWMWGPNRTDGGMYRGLGNLDGEITLDPAFAEESYAANGWGSDGDSWPWANNTRDWAVRSDRGLVGLDTSEPATVRAGSCDGGPPAADLTASPNPVSEGEPVTLDASGSDDDGTIVEYRWDLDGDGSVDETTDAATIDRTFSQDATVTVTVVDDDGYESTASVDLAVEDDTPPVALASANESTVAVGESVAFDASDSYDEESAVSYEWNLGDGTTATGPTVAHAYDAAGQYSATVTVTDEAGNANQTTVPVEVTEPGPAAALDAPDAVGTGEEVTLDASGSTGDIAEYRWTVDGETETTNTSTLTRQFSEPGTVDASVTVVDDQGRSDEASTSIQVSDSEALLAAVDGPNATVVGETVTFDGRNSTGDVSAYEWDLGDGTTATGATASHTYAEPGEYEVTLNVTDSTGSYDRTTHTVAVEADPAPTADLVAPAETGVGTTVSLDASGSSDPGGIETYRWDLDGDGTFENETDSPTNAVSFNETGAHTVGVEVVDGEGQTDATEATIDVVDAPPSVAITGVESANAGERITLSAEVDDDRGVERVEWEFGDGATATGTTVTHTYDEPGEYEVTVTAVDTAGNSASSMTTVTVGDGGDGNDDSGDSGNQGDSDDSGNQNDGRDSADGDDGGDDDAPSSGGGGGGGGAPAADDEPSTPVDTDLGDSPSVDVNETDAGTHVDVAGASADESVRASLDDGPLRSVSITPSDDGSASLVVNRSVDAEAPNGTDAVLATARPANVTGVAALEYGFALSASDLSERGVDADNLTAARQTDDGWESVNATVERDGDEVRVNASVDDAAPVVLAAPAPSLTAEDVDVGEAVAGEPVPVDVTLVNEGHANGTGSLRLVADGRAVDSRDVTLAPGERTTVEMTAQFRESGERSVSVAGEQATVDVAANEPDVELSSVTIANDTVRAGEAVEITATYVNRGHAAGNATANVTAFDERVAEKHVEVGPGERRNVTVTQSFDAPGTYEIAVDGEQRTVEVVASDAATETATATEGDADAGVGGGLPTLAAGGVVLLLVSAAIASRAMG